MTILSRRLVWLMVIATAAAVAPAQAQSLKTLLVSAKTASDLGDYTILWQEPLTLAPNNTPKHLEILGDTVVSFEHGNFVSVLDAATGKVLWRDAVGKPDDTFSKPVRKDRVLVMCTATRAFAYDARGGKLGSAYPLAMKVAGTDPVLYEDLMILSSATGVVFAQDLTQGRVHWKYALRAPTATSPFMSGKTLIATNSVGEIAGFTPRTGVLQWRERAFKQISAAAGGANESPLVYAASKDMSLYAWDRNSGALRWRNFYEEQLHRKPIALGELVFQWVPKRGLLALNAFTGKEEWVRKDLKDAKPFMIRNGLMYFHRPGRIEMIAPKDGLTVKQVAIPRVHIVRADKQLDGDIYLMNNDGRVMRLSLK